MKRSLPSLRHKTSVFGAAFSLGILLVLEAAWAAAWLWAALTAGHHWVVIVMMLIGVGGLIACWFMILHGIYLMYALLPRIDRHLDPNLANYTRQRGDPLFWRFHRVLFYAGSAAWNWVHRRLEYHTYDFDGLPPSLRLPLLIEFYALVGGVLALGVGAALMAVSRELGLL